MDLLPAIQQSIEIVGKLRALSKKVADAEFKMLLADLSSELADAKLEAANLKSEIAALKTENQALREVVERRQSASPILADNVYHFEGEQGNFCTACYDTKGQKVRVTALKGHFADLATWLCPSCNATYG